MRYSLHNGDFKRKKKTNNEKQNEILAGMVVI